MADRVSLPALDAMGSVLPGTGPFPHGEQRSQEISGDRPEPGVGTYHLALQRMAGDLLSLRRRVASLEVENGHLRHSLGQLQQRGQLRDTDLDTMSRDELLDRLATLGAALAAGTAELRGLKDRVQQLQNELIRKNDREKELVLLQRRHRQQEVALRRCQDRVAKARGLEQALRQQEKVIEAMERLLQEKPGRSTERAAGAALGGDALGGDALAALLAENRRLREELAGPPRAPGAPLVRAGRGHGAGPGDRACPGGRWSPAVPSAARSVPAGCPGGRGEAVAAGPAGGGPSPRAGAGEAAAGGGPAVGPGEAGAGDAPAGAGARLPPRPEAPSDFRVPPEATSGAARPALSPERRRHAGLEQSSFSLEQRQSEAKRDIPGGRGGAAVVPG